jgi:hypothetical protein
MARQRRGIALLTSALAILTATAVNGSLPPPHKQQRQWGIRPKTRPSSTVRSTPTTPASWATGFVNLTNEVGSYVEWGLSAADAGEVKQGIRQRRAQPR